MITLSRSFLVALCLGALSVNLLNADVLSWRNGGMGTFPDSTVSTGWVDGGEVVWSSDFAWSNASPILVSDKLFIMEEPDRLVCLDSATGEVVWSVRNSLLALKGLSPEEIEEANETIAKSLELDREVDRTFYNITRLYKRRSPNISDEEFKKLADEKLQAYHAAGEAKTAFASEDRFGGLVSPATHPTNGYTSYTPVSDGEFLYVAYGSGAVVKHDLVGNRTWHTVLDDTDHIFGGSTSPILAGGKLLVRFSDYVALDIETGEELWRTPTSTSFGTPVEFTVEGESFVVTSRGEVLNISDGTMINSELVEFLVPEMEWSAFNSPVIDGEHIYFVRGLEGREGDAYCFIIPDSLEEMTETGLTEKWRVEVRKNRYYASPVIYDGLLYTLSADHRLTVLDAGTGEIKYEQRVEGMVGIAYPSICLSGTTLVMSSDNGMVVLVEPGPEYQEIERGLIGAFRSTPIFEGDTVYLRTLDNIKALKGAEA